MKTSSVGGSRRADACLLDCDFVEVLLVVILMLAPMDGAELKEAEPVLGRIAAETRGAALQCVGANAVLLWNLGESLGRERLRYFLGTGVGIRRARCQRQECRGPALGNPEGEIDSLLAQSAELLRGGYRHCAEDGWVRFHARSSNPSLSFRKGRVETDGSSAVWPGKKEEGRRGGEQKSRRNLGECRRGAGGRPYMLWELPYPTLPTLILPPLPSRCSAEAFT